ncbi:MAG: hypothetical protein KA163_12015 [Bacteroidia bacterium]|nr:hypothetical protein [Bacteroidia bacterium]
MSTITKNISQSQVNSSELGLVARYNKFIEDLKFSHFGLISMTILFGSIMGGIASMYVFQSGAPMWQFIVGLAFSMANLVAAISQAPTKWAFNLFVLSVIVNVLLILANI